jgi:hypothetical protein
LEQTLSIYRKNSKTIRKEILKKCYYPKKFIKIPD